MQNLNKLSQISSKSILRKFVEAMLIQISKFFKTKITDEEEKEIKEENFNLRFKRRIKSNNKKNLR